MDFPLLKKPKNYLILFRIIFIKFDSIEGLGKTINLVFSLYERDHVDHSLDNICEPHNLIIIWECHLPITLTITFWIICEFKAI